VLSHFDKGNGVCRYLKNNLCAIYDKRPIICNVGEMYKMSFKTFISEKEFIRENLKACLQLAQVFNNSFAEKQIKSILDKIIQPKDIPPIVPDCGWNHGEIIGESKESKAAL
jgi:hypothetical protein